MTAPKPLSPPAVHARAAALWDAAIELVRATDAVRELTRLGRATGEEKRRLDAAADVWDRLNGRRWAR